MSFLDKIKPSMADKSVLSDDELRYILMMIAESTFSGKDVLVVSEIVNKIQNKLDGTPNKR
jgi:hypothetical protein